jgi:hypothetical protein
VGASLVMIIVALVDIVNFFAVPSLIYWFNIRRKLQDVETAAASRRYGPGRMTYAGWGPVPALTPHPRHGTTRRLVSGPEWRRAFPLEGRRAVDRARVRWRNADP